MLRHARTLVQAPGIDFAAEIFTDFAARKAFITRHAPSNRAGGKAKRPEQTRKVKT